MLDICDLDNIEHGDNVEISTKHSVKDFICPFLSS